ncbi:hypothetical protein Dsin_032468 [Dipteronia sinensis]|uniref:Pentatricopeptide repeat-containing protein n=1 Tax=Dipteronia sinensis TaxID=43782 RepID=A0AAD9ZNP0_9ROSI|nr:hypothetical protein Dsin_032468 [Dipteronia sinensis]
MAEENRARLHEFLHGKCKSGKIDLHEAFYFFDYMTHMQPTPLMSCFNILFTTLVKNKHYGDVISLHTRMNSVGLVPDLITSNILINCCCKMSRFGDGFVVFGALLRRGFNCLIKGLCMEGRIMEATRLLKQMISFGRRPNVVTFATLIHGSIVALQLHEQMVNRNSKYSVTCKPNVVWYGSITDGLCKDGFIDKAKELFLEMKGNESLRMQSFIPLIFMAYVVLVIGKRLKVFL